MDVVLDGLLLKSPPAKRFCKGVRKWRERWFVLRHSGHIPGQFVLEYYTDSTCRKLKGKIDLDQCEQVDSGLPYENRKTNHQHMFNIHTPKRVYYLVAKTELEMNKWVDCICSVCGLKIRVEDELSPAVEPVSSLPTAAITSPPSIIATPAPSISNLTTTNSESSPYIPISECITGKPITNGFATAERRKTNPSPQPPKAMQRSLDNILSNVPPPPPKPAPLSEACSAPDEFYDHPKPVFFPSQRCNNTTNNGRTSPEPNMEDMYKIPPPMTRAVLERPDWEGAFAADDDSMPLFPPKVNWQTYPENGGPANSTYDVPVNQNLNSTYDFPTNHAHISNSDYDIPVPQNANSTYDIPVNQNVGMKYLTLQEKSKPTHIESRDVDSASPLHSGDDSVNGDPAAPPRPPKPPNLGDKKTKIDLDTVVGASNNNSGSMVPNATANNSANNAIPGASVYDIPPSAKGVFLSKHLPAEVFSFLNDDTKELVDLSPSTKVPQTKQLSPLDADEMYDFPRFRSDNQLGKKVPLPQASHSSLRRPRQHAYTNAPPGLFSGKNNVMNYEYRPSLMNKDPPPNLVTATTDGGAIIVAESVSFEANSPPPLYSPVMAAIESTYTNIGGSADDLSDMPPVINRGLKPKKKLSDPNEPGFGPFNLAPPPALQPGHSKCSFRKQRAAPSPVASSIPLIPYRPGHLTDQSSSDDDSSFGGSRRNSNNDDQMHFLSPPAPYKIKQEIQYLDLDLDSDGAAQSPRSPDRSSTSTVYKTVDFVKTNALNVVKQNVNETYRKNQ